MPEDLSFPFEYNETGDRAAVSGDDFYYQHAQLLGLIASDNISGNPLTRTTAIALQDRLANLFANSPYFEPPVQVQITQTNNEEIVAEVDVNNLSTFEIVI